MWLSIQNLPDFTQLLTVGYIHKQEFLWTNKLLVFLHNHSKKKVEIN